MAQVRIRSHHGMHLCSPDQRCTPGAGPAGPLAGISYRHGYQGVESLRAAGRGETPGGSPTACPCRSHFPLWRCCFLRNIGSAPPGPANRLENWIQTIAHTSHSATLSLGFAWGRAAADSGLEAATPLSAEPSAPPGPRADLANLQGAIRGSSRPARRLGRPARDFTSAPGRGALRTRAAALSPASRCQAPARPAARRPRAGRG